MKLSLKRPWGRLVAGNCRDSSAGSGRVSAEPEPEPESTEPAWEERLEVRPPGGNHQTDEKMKKSMGVRQGGDGADELEPTSLSIRRY